MTQTGNIILDVVIIVVKIAIVFGVNFTILAYLTLAERRVSAFMQDRLGPNRVGPQGLFQPIADGVKFFTKEDIIPAKSDKFLYLLAPAVVFFPAFLTYAIIPVGPTFSAWGHSFQMQIANLNIGILYIFALTSFVVYGIVLAGWSSNSKYPLMGGLRSGAQMISYELSLGLSIIGILMIVGSLRLSDIVTYQNNLLWGVLPRWGVVLQPLGFIIFLIASFAESNRLPFDLPEAEPELVGGYHTEYGSMKFALFFLGEYAGLITSSALIATLFFGGWDFPWVNESALGAWGVVLGMIAFAVKTGFFLFFYLWIRWTLPRFRYDQLMRIGWKSLLPLALVNIVITAIVMVFFV
ncbi:MAG: NADH-quinone oxidoreductase subunit NuoH [Calditrichaeota bacterium]|nr:NADH-quinone oxidoreductase subunit NuoH [Calditrichota bacterium]